MLAGSTGKRTEQENTQYLYAVWSRVDNRIQLPAGLTGEALLNKLEGVEQPSSAVRQIRFSPRVFTWQSGVTYAAAFALIVTLSLFLNRGTSQADILQGQIQVESEAIEQAAAFAEPDLQEAPEPAASPEIEEAAAARVDAALSSAAAQMSGKAEDAGGGQGEAPAEPEAQSAEGIGGQSRSVLLGEDERYTYTYRHNDPSDPDREGYPITVNIMDIQSGELICTFDLSQELSLTGYYVNGEILALTGAPAEGGAAAVVYNLADMARPEELIVMEQPGIPAGANLYGNVLRLTTLTESAEGLECEVVSLPGAVSEDCYVITALDLDTLITETKAFAGLNGGEASLYDLHAYIRYEGEPVEDSSGKHVAQIRLEGTIIELVDGEAAEAE